MHECQTCGCTGLHACIGHKPSPWSEEEIIRLREALTEMANDICLPKDEGYATQWSAE